jgi:microsomal dipeptidase-like Zn-dependent dipeptidase
MAEHHVMVDVAHMSEQALRDTFELLGEVAPDAPPIATHIATRQGRKGLDYNLREWAAREIARRDGVMGMIMGDHIATDGLRTRKLSRGRRTADFDDSFDVLRSHIDQLYAWTGSHDHTGIGSDLDGFIKPTLAGIEDARDLRKLEVAIGERYRDAQVADRICSGNALRLLRTYWRPGT